MREGEGEGGGGPRVLCNCHVWELGKNNGDCSDGLTPNSNSLFSAHQDPVAVPRIAELETELATEKQRSRALQAEVTRLRETVARLVSGAPFKASTIVALPAAVSLPRQGTHRPRPHPTPPHPLRYAYS